MLIVTMVQVPGHLLAYGAALLGGVVRRLQTLGGLATLLALLTLAWAGVLAALARRGRPALCDFLWLLVPTPDYPYLGTQEVGARESDMALLYSTRFWREAGGSIRRYGIRYIVVGDLERSRYGVGEEKFRHCLEVVLRAGNTTPYSMPEVLPLR